MLTNDGAEVTMAGERDPRSMIQHSVRVRLLRRNQILLVNCWNVLLGAKQAQSTTKTLTCVRVRACACMQAHACVKICVNVRGCV